MSGLWGNSYISLSGLTWKMTHVSGVPDLQWGDVRGVHRVRLANASERQVRLWHVGIAAGYEPSEDQVLLRWLSQVGARHHWKLSSLMPLSATLLPGRWPRRFHRRQTSQ